MDKIKNTSLIITSMICLVFSSAGICATTKGQTPKILAELTEYYESGNYFKEIKAELKKAKKYVDIQIRNRKDSNLAVVLDIDETALSNFHNLKRMYFTGNTEAFTAAYLLGDLPAIDPVLDFYEYLVNNNVAVFFVTSRPNTAEISTVTVMNLKSAGYHTWENIYMRPVHLDKLSALEFKTQARKDIVHKGFEIILTIGDQDNDIQGGFTEVKAKLPNPFYQIS